MNKQDWTYKKLGDICKVLNGLWVGKKEPFVNIAVIRNTNFSKDCKLKLDDVAYIDVEEKQFATRKLQSGDIIIEKSGGSDKQPVGRPVLFNITDGDYSFSNFTSTLRLTDKNIFPPFLHYCLYGYYRNGETTKMQSKTTGLRNLDMKAYLRLAIPYLEIGEQERIVEELDLLSGIIEKKKEQLKAYDQLAQSIFYTMFGDPIDNPKGWETKKLGEIANCTSGGTPSRRVPRFFEGTINWFSAGELNNMYLTDSIEKITQEALDNSNAKLCPANSLFIGMYDTAAFKLGIPIKDSASNQACANVELSNDNVIWLYYSLLLMRDEALKHRHGARQKNLNLRFIKDFYVPVPPLSLQQEFAEKVEAIERQKALVQQSIEEAQTMFDCTMDKYFG